MWRIFLMIFGVYGIAIACMQGIEAFLELSKWISWFTENWINFVRKFWTWAFSWLGLSIDNSIADGMSGFAYTVSLFVGYRRADVAMKKFAEKYFIGAFKSKEWLEKNLPYGLGKLLSLVLSFLMFLPYLIVFFMLWNSSDWMAIAFLVCCTVINFINYPEMGRKFILWLSGEADEESAIATMGLAPVAYVISSTLILLLLFSVLIVNEIALNGDNLTDFFNWARCDAGIQCD